MAELLTNRKAFVPPPLANAETQIRLLRFLPECNDDHLFLEQNTWDMDSLPKYNAISYAWGDPGNPVAVKVNGSMLCVRQNCAYALWQAWLHFRKARIWIDSICINQSNNAEKSLQVAIMGDIYSKAEQVLICIGRSADDSDFFMQNVCKLYEWLSSSNVLKRQYGRVRSRALAHDEDYWPRLIQAHDELCNRAYWQRVWIVQEVALAKKGILLCGRQWLLWKAFMAKSDIEPRIRTKELMATNSVRPRVRTTRPRWPSSLVKPRPTFGVFELEKTVLADAFDFMCDRLCSDPRDRLYALLQMIDWNSTTLGKMAPDYDLNVYDLALRVLPDLDISHTKRLVYAFEMGHSDQWVMERRQQQGTCTEKITSAVRCGDHFHENFTIKASSWSSGEANFVPIQRQVSGRLCAPSLKDRCGLGKRLFHPNFLQPSLLTDIDPQRQGIFVDEKIKALTCAATMPGDMLMILDCTDCNSNGVCLVVRQRSELIFDIVGQAVCFGADFPIWGDEALRTGIVNISLSLEEQLFLFAQDARKRHENWTVGPWDVGDIKVRLERLNTLVTAFPQGAVRLSHKYGKGWD